MIKQMEAIIESLRPQMEAVKWDDPFYYATWLSQAYYIANRSTSFLGLCLFHADKYPEFQKRCGQHIGEETGHEKLITNDLKQLGYPLLPELPSTMAVYQPQYFRIVAENPLSFVGYVFFLELLAPAYGPYVMNRVPNKKALSFLKVHTSADEDHIESATKILEIVPEEVRGKIMTNFQMSFESYRLMLAQIQKAQKEQKRAA